MKVPQLPIHVRRDAGISVVLAIQMSIMFVIGPLGSTGWLSPAVFEIFRFGLAAAAVMLLAPSRIVVTLITFAFLATLILPLAVGSGEAGTTIRLVRHAATGAFDFTVAASVARVVFGPGEINIHRIMGGVVVYLSIALFFANAFGVGALLLHPSFSGLSNDPHSRLTTLLYFSLTTLTTTGYGDILPVHPFIRSLANLEAVMGQLYPATLLARLVTLHAQKDRASR